MDTNRPIRRREFVKNTAVGVTALSAAPAYLSALGANEKLLAGVIGVGRRGSSHVRNLLKLSKEYNFEIAAVCDIYRPRVDAAAQKTGAKGYADYNELLARGDLDFVVIASPDHWHGQMSIDAVRAGCDVYCEKPWTRYAHEAKEAYRAVKKEKKILQVGTQHTADGRYWAARDAIQKGLVGKRVWSQTSYSRNYRHGAWNYDVDNNASPENLDWEEFLGTAKPKPFNREHFFRFRKYWDYSGGIATDLHYHVLAPVLLAVGADFPRRVTSGGGIWVHKDPGHPSPREVPDTFMTLIDMPEEHSIVIASSLANDNSLPDLVRGHEATLSITGGGVEIRPQGLYRDEFVAEHGKDVISLPAQPRDNHMVNFLKTVRTRREEDLNCGPDLGYKTMVCIAMSVKAYRENKVLFWDAEKEEIVENEPAKKA